MTDVLIIHVDCKVTKLLLQFDNDYQTWVRTQLEIDILFFIDDFTTTFITWCLTIYHFLG